METKTKFVKVSVEERLPNKSGYYFTDEGIVYFVYENKEWGREVNILEWLEEVPDREAEMLEMLKLISEKAEEIYHEEDGEDNRFFEEIDFEKLDQLIQEATTLK